MLSSSSTKFTYATRLETKFDLMKQAYLQLAKLIEMFKSESAFFYPGCSLPDFLTQLIRLTQFEAYVTISPTRTP